VIIPAGLGLLLFLVPLLGHGRMRKFGHVFGVLVVGGVLTGAAALTMLGGGCRKSLFVPVNGVVNLDGAPLAGAMVSFMPEKGESAPVGHGWTRPDGSFELTSLNEVGALPGEYRVVITKRVPIKGVEADPLKAAQEALKKGKPPTDLSQITKSVVPEDYGHPTRTPLRCSVPATAKLVLDVRSTVASAK